MRCVPPPSALPLVVACILSVPGLLHGQANALGTPTLTATAKGPDQINLTWPRVTNPGYGYIVEIQSTADTRYSS